MVLSLRINFQGGRGPFVLSTAALVLQKWEFFCTISGEK